MSKWVRLEHGTFIRWSDVWKVGWERNDADEYISVFYVRGHECSTYVFLGKVDMPGCEVDSETVDELNRYAIEYIESADRVVFPVEALCGIAHMEYGRD